MTNNLKLIRKSSVLILGCLIGFSLLLTGCKASKATLPDASQVTPTSTPAATASPGDAQNSPTLVPTAAATPGAAQNTTVPVIPDFAGAEQNTWIWDNTMISSDDTINQLVEYHFTDAYVFFSRRIASKFDKFIGKASDQGIKVEALMGSADMALSDNYDAFEQQVKSVLDYNKAYSNRFAAIHLDIEPYTLPDWDSHMQEYLTSYLDNLTKVRQLIDQHNKDNNDTLKLVLDIPFWYYQSQFDFDGVNVLDSLFDVADELVIMDYTKSQSAFMSNGISNLKIADKHPGKLLKVGMEFQSQVTDVTLYDKSPEQFQQYITASLKEFEKHPSFGGYAMHYLNVYVDYLNKGTKE